MKTYQERMEMALEAVLEMLPRTLERENDPARNAEGGMTSMLIGDLRDIAVTAYTLRKDKAEFLTKLSESAAKKLILFERHEKGEPIDNSYVAMLSYEHLFDALAAGNFDLARRLATHMGGRDAIEKEHDHPFDYALGYTLKSFVLNDRPAMEKWTAVFESECMKSENKDFQGYPMVFKGVLDKDASKVKEGFDLIIKGHKKQSKGSGVFMFTPDEMLCVWGVGLANLVRSFGVDFEIDDPLIPAELFS